MSWNRPFYEIKNNLQFFPSLASYLAGVFDVHWGSRAEVHILVEIQFDVHLVFVAILLFPTDVNNMFVFYHSYNEIIVTNVNNMATLSVYL